MHFLKEETNKQNKKIIKASKAKTTIFVMYLEEDKIT